ncbi:RTA1 like protein-domain-containing protein [Mycena sp. CBHHK59/15]|nr:RTA1 like protein-domain-containing protein [Mycena sp. CBHHK59/15]
MVQVQCFDPRTTENYNFLYCPSFPAAVLFSVLFGLTTIAHIIQAVHYHKPFCWVIVMAGAWETGGLVLRVFSVLHTTSAAFGTPSQLLILLAPLWINAFSYLVMSRIVHFFLPERHVFGINARRLSLCFVLLDITAFLMQAGGGVIIDADSSRIALMGIHIYMGGIGLQQFFIFLFVGLVVRFHYKMNRLPFSDRPTDWRTLLRVLYASLVLITIRIVFRLIEFSSGVYSPLTMHEAPFYCLEALPMFVAIVLWHVWHPGQVLVGPDSEFPKKVKEKKNKNKNKNKSKNETDEFGKEIDVHLLASRGGSPQLAA